MYNIKCLFCHIVSVISDTLHGILHIYINLIRLGIELVHSALNNWSIFYLTNANANFLVCPAGGWLYLPSAVSETVCDWQMAEMYTHSPGAGAPCTAAGTCSTSCGRTSATWSALAWCSISRTAVRASGPNVWRSTDTNRTNRSDQRETKKKTYKDQHSELWLKQAHHILVI